MKLNPYHSLSSYLTLSQNKSLDSHPFKGRTLAVINDLNNEERIYLYQQTRMLKQALHTHNEEVLSRFRINNLDFGIYEVFLEDSTRTKESFRNAAHFHRVKFSELHTTTSSFNKQESYADTFTNLVGYDNHIFIIRSKLEGLCRYLEDITKKYLVRNQLSYNISFINAGDGRHEHPTQELLDEFTFLEDLDWNTECIHLALIGDLYNGRTVHSKARGLSMFKKVYIDLVAPDELRMPEVYIDEMKESGFVLREFESLSDYLSQDNIALQWYFTRPQLERMGEQVLRKADSLRNAISFNPQVIDTLNPKTRFYHPLPRHRDYPTIPYSIDNTFLNAWERQSANGRIVRMVLLAMLAGHIGDDYASDKKYSSHQEKDFIEEVAVDKKSDTQKQYSEGIRPIRNGLVIDHIMCGEDMQYIRNHLKTVTSVLNLYGKGGEWISEGSTGKSKGLLFRPNHPPLDHSEIRKLAAVIPGATVNVVVDGKIAKKYRLGYPKFIYGLPELICNNEQCITHPSNGEHTLPRFKRSVQGKYICEFCSTAHQFTEVWQ